MKHVVESDRDNMFFVVQKKPYLITSIVPPK